MKFILLHKNLKNLYKKNYLGVDVNDFKKIKKNYLLLEAHSKGILYLAEQFLKKYILEYKYFV